MVLNKREWATKQDLEEQGYETIHQGIQDFTAVKGRCPHHEFCPYIHFVETKSETDKLSLNQRRARTILKKHGFKVTVERRTENGEIYHASPTTSSPEQNTPDQSIQPILASPFQSRSALSIPTLDIPVQTRSLDQSISNHVRPCLTRPVRPIPGQVRTEQIIPVLSNPNVEEVK